MQHSCNTSVVNLHNHYCRSESGWGLLVSTECYSY